MYRLLLYQSSVAKCEKARKDTLIPNYTIIANLTANVKLFFEKQSAISHQPSVVGIRLSLVSESRDRKFAPTENNSWKIKIMGKPNGADF